MRLLMNLPIVLSNSIPRVAPEICKIRATAFLDPKKALDSPVGPFRGFPCLAQGKYYA
jgi:hypothetical protein